MTLTEHRRAVSSGGAWLQTNLQGACMSSGGALYYYNSCTMHSVKGLKKTMNKGGDTQGTTEEPYPQYIDFGNVTIY